MRHTLVLLWESPGFNLACFMFLNLATSFLPMSSLVQVMLRLLGTHLGRSAIYTMCTFVQERYVLIQAYVAIMSVVSYRSGSQDALLLRGAVFYISMSMWGIRRVETLELAFTAVLPSLKLVSVLTAH